MAILQTRQFARFARREGIKDAYLCEAAARAERGLVDADLGGGLIKQRIARQGQGRSGGFRTLMAFREGQHTICLYGFAKNERDNIGADELVFWRRVAGAFLAMSAAAFASLTAAGEIMEVERDG